MLAATWDRVGSDACLSCGALRARIDASSPARGLTQVAWSSADTTADVGGQLLGVETHAGPLSQPAETYVRGADFVSTQSGSHEFPFRAQAYWSAFGLTENVAAATLTLSLQTNLLDTRPQVAVVSRLDCSSARFECNDAGLCTARAADGLAVTITPHPSDAVDATPEVDGATHRLWLRPPFLEKGVIRRFQVAAFVSDQELTGTTLARAVQAFADLPMPLTT